MGERKMKYRQGIFVVIFARNRKNKIEYLILHRKLHWKGWEFPKGGRKFWELGRCTARRETKEETGLKILRIKKFDFSGKYKYDKEYADRNGLTGQTFRLFCAEVRKGKVKIDKKEHSGFKWMSFNQAVRSVRFPNQKKSLKIVDEWLERRK